MDVASVEVALATIEKYLGSIDAHMYSAGVWGMAKIQEMTVEYWDQVIAINAKGPFFMIQQSVNYFEKICPHL